MITKRLLDSIEAFEVESTFGHYTAHDVYTLHFRQWWKKNKVIKMGRKISKQDFDKGTFSHSQTPESTTFNDMLADHINRSYKNSNVKGMEKCPVLQLVPTSNDDK